MGAPSTTIDGQTFFTPGVRSVLNGDSLAKGGAAPAGIVAVLGVFERLTPKTPTSVSAPDDMRKKLPTLGPRIANLLYESSADAKVRGRPNGVYLVRVNPATRASAVLKDANAVDVLKLEADDYGVYGNQAWFKAENGTAANSQKFTIGRGASFVVVDNILLEVFSLTNADTTELAALKLIVDPTPSTGKVQVTFQSIAFALNTDPKTITPTKLAFDGALTLTLDQVSGNAGTQAVVSGRNKAGALVSEVVTFGAATTVRTTTTLWSDVTSIVTSADATATTLTLSGDAWNLPITDYDTVAKVLEKIDLYAGRGYVTARLTGEDFNIVDLDAIASPGIAAENLNVAKSKANLFETIRRINAEAALYVAASKVSGGKLPAANVATGFLGGGGEGSTADSDWQTALDNIRDIECDTVVVLSSSASIHAKLSAHLRYMEGDGRDERAGFVGAATGESLDTLKTRKIALNNRNCALCGQEIQVYSASGAKEWLEPYWQALQVAGLFASLRVGVGLTEKIMNVLDVRNATSWSPQPGNGSEDVIKNGILAYYKHKKGFKKLLRQVTTYSQTTHEVYGLVAPNASANRSIKNVRAVIEPFLGDPDVDVTDTFLKRTTIDELNRQVTDKEITAFDPESVTFVPITGGYKGAYALAPVGTLEFVNITGNLVRASDIPAAA